MKYRATTTSILLPSGDLAMPGCLVPDGALSDAQIARLVSMGTLAPAEAAPTAPEAPAEVEEARPPSVWTCDPVVIGRKSLKALQVMIRERDDTHPMPETVEECIAILSQDWRGK